MAYIPYSPEDDATILQNYMTMGPSGLGRSLNRNPCSVRQRAIKLGINVTAYRCAASNRLPKWKWTEEDDRTIRNRYSQLGPSRLSELIHKPPQAIIDRARSIGVLRKKRGSGRVQYVHDGRPELNISEDGEVQRICPMEPHPCLYVDDKDERCEAVMQPNDRSGEWSRYGDKWICPNCLPRWSREHQGDFTREVPTGSARWKDEP